MNKKIRPGTEGVKTANTSLITSYRFEYDNPFPWLTLSDLQGD
ncbi:hypothetical protein E2C01_044640 [Portunus trituberculatus]|uniref:Uncharacterized protein n=1 Tax=Portunus trituberculatus TaxID=210409 RepID=A0A5B7FYX2_PORTR|nr:hypothetical protein [Portunus trituberculatus]